MNTDFYPEPRHILCGLAKIAVAAALAFFPVYTIDQPFTITLWAIDLVLMVTSALLLVIGSEQIFDEFDKPES